MNNTSVEVTAGMGGFLVMFGLMIVIWLLGRDLTRRLRRMRMAEQQRVEAVLRERAGHGEQAQQAPQSQQATKAQPAQPAQPDNDGGPDPIG